MPLVIILIGVVLLVAALKNTQGKLATALETDVPPFAKWFAALAAVGALGWVPGLRTVSRWLLGLVLLVLVLKNYQQIFTGFANVASGAGSGAVTQTQATPAQAYIANPNAPQITLAEVTGSPSGNVNANAAATTTLPAVANPFDPQQLLAEVEGTAGFVNLVGAFA